MISARLIRECADLICNIFNQSIGQGMFPDDWKCARVAPLFKAGDRNDVNNYRPISVISIVAKVFERIVYDQLYAYLEEHSIICKYQSGFRSTHSTVTALLEATDTWAYNIDRGKINAVVFLDLKKAFDTVDHKILLSKLSHYGICRNEYNWFKSYLENRTQMCSINGSLSNNRSLTCGVPQGTILGPLLFLLLPPQGFRPEAKSRGGTLVARAYIKDSTYSTNMQSVYRKNLDLLEQGPRGIGR